MKKLPLLAFMSMLILSCQSSKQPQSNGEITQQEGSHEPNPLHSEINGYPKLIDSLGLQEKYDETKWKIYLLSCDDTPKTATGKYIITPPQPFGSYNLLLDSLVTLTDTLIFYFDFYDAQGEPVNLIKYRDMKNPSDNGLMFYPTKETYTNCYISNHSEPWKYCVVVAPVTKEDKIKSKAFCDTTSNRLLKPLQPKVIRFMELHKREINPWLYKEAIKRGVLKE